MTDKFCKDCAFCAPSTISSKKNRLRFSTCRHPSSVKRDAQTEDDLAVYLTTGVPTKAEPETYFCTTMRVSISDQFCGPEGKFFEFGPVAPPKKGAIASFFDFLRGGA